MGKLKFPARFHYQPKAFFRPTRFSAVFTKTGLKQKVLDLAQESFQLLVFLKQIEWKKEAS